MFFIDHTAKSTSFIDPRLPNDLPLLQNEAAGVTHLTIPSLLPPLPPRHHGASLTPPPSARAPTSPMVSPMSPNNLLAPPSDGVNRRRSRSVGDEELNSCLTQQNSNMISYSGSASPTLAYNDRQRDIKEGVTKHINKLTNINYKFNWFKFKKEMHFWSFTTNVWPFLFPQGFRRKQNGLKS